MFLEGSVRYVPCSVIDEFLFFFTNVEYGWSQRAEYTRTIYEPLQHVLTRKIIVHPSQNRHYLQIAGEVIRVAVPLDRDGSDRAHVSVPWGVKCITILSRYTAQRDRKGSPFIALSEISRQSATFVGALLFLTRLRALTNSAYCTLLR